MQVGRFEDCCFIGNVFVSVLAYTDDIALLASNYTGYAFNAWHLRGFCAGIRNCF